MSNSLGLNFPYKTSAMAPPPASPGYPTQRMLEILSSLFANEMSNGPPDMMMRITKPLATFATSWTKTVCCPGRLRSVLSKPSLSMDWSAPTMRMVTSAWAAACLAGSSWNPLAEQLTSEQPATAETFEFEAAWIRPWSGDMYLQGAPSKIRK